MAAFEDEPGLTAEPAGTLGTVLAKARKQRGWTLRQAEQHSGVPNAHISQIETGTIQRPGAATLLRLADAYDLPPAALIAQAGRDGELLAGEVRDRELLGQAAEVLWSLCKHALTVKPLLTAPYPDYPEWTPWTRWIERDAHRAHDLAVEIRKHLRGSVAGPQDGKNSTEEG